MAIRSLPSLTQRLCKSCGDWHYLDRWPHNCLPEKPNRSDYPSPAVISDYLPGGVNGLYHHGVARKIDSKSKYRQATKDSGCIEVGNDFDASVKREPKFLDQKTIQSAVNEALHQHGISSDEDLKRLDYGGY